MIPRRKLTTCHELQGVPGHVPEDRLAPQLAADGSHAVDEVVEDLESGHGPRVNGSSLPEMIVVTDH